MPTSVNVRLHYVEAGDTVKWSAEPWSTGSQLSRHEDESSTDNCRPSCPQQTFATNARTRSRVQWQTGQFQNLRPPRAPRARHRIDRALDRKLFPRADWGP